ncbi:MAG: hypothetical protein ACFFGZ_12530 [Candidatus Thorarchaeota archaeon]
MTHRSTALPKEVLHIMNTIRGDSRNIVRPSLLSAFLWPGFIYSLPLKNQLATLSIFLGNGFKDALTSNYIDLGGTH